MSENREPSLTLEGYATKFDTPCKIFLPQNLTKEEFLQLLNSPRDKPAYTFPALQDWLSKLLQNFSLQEHPCHTFHKHPYKLREIDVQAVDWFWRNRPGYEDKLGFMKIVAKVETDPYVHEEGEKPRADWLPAAIFLRGGSVGVLIIVQPSDAQNDDEKYVILTVQPRLAAGSLAFTEIPAGMLDGNSFKGTAANEIEEEAKLTVRESDLLNMSELAVEDVPMHPWSSLNGNETGLPQEVIQNSMYPSVGGCDEFLPLFLCQKRLTRKHMEWLRGRATGLRAEGENITLKLVPLERAWKEGGRDAKALAALALYENLKREGKLPEMPSEAEPEPEEL